MTCEVKHDMPGTLIHVSPRSQGRFHPQGGGAPPSWPLHMPSALTLQSILPDFSASAQLARVLEN